MFQQKEKFFGSAHLTWLQSYFAEVAFSLSLGPTSAFAGKDFYTLYLLIIFNGSKTGSGYFMKHYVCNNK